MPQSLQYVCPHGARNCDVVESSGSKHAVQVWPDWSEGVVVLDSVMTEKVEGERERILQQNVKWKRSLLNDSITCDNCTFGSFVHFVEWYRAFVPQLHLGVSY